MQISCTPTLLRASDLSGTKMVCNIGKIEHVTTVKAKQIILKMSKYGVSKMINNKKPTYVGHSCQRSPFAVCNNRLDETNTRASPSTVPLFVGKRCNRVIYTSNSSPTSI